MNFQRFKELFEELYEHTILYPAHFCSEDVDYALEDIYVSSYSKSAVPDNISDHITEFVEMWEEHELIDSYQGPDSDYAGYDGYDIWAVYWLPRINAHVKFEGRYASYHGNDFTKMYQVEKGEVVRIDWKKIDN